MNNKITQVIIAVVLVGVSFFAGMKYSSSKSTNQNIGRAGNFAGGNFTQGQGQRAGRAGMGNGITFGEILSQDANGITVKAQDGSSKIVLVSNTTVISKQTSGSLSDLGVGKSVSVMGTANQDGSITAQSVQLRTASSTIQFRQN